MFFSKELTTTIQKTSKIYPTKALIDEKIDKGVLFLGYTNIFLAENNDKVQ
jgi:hypothetical protein